MGKFKTGCLGAIGVVLAIALIGSCAGGGSKDESKAPTSSSASSSSSSGEQKQKVYEDAGINGLIKEAKENAASANANYKKKNLRVIGGRLSNIDSDMKYITLEGTDRNYSMIHVQCSINSKNQDVKDAVLKLKKGEPVTVYGTVSEVGDLVGYRMSLDKIEPAQ